MTNIFAICLVLTTMLAADIWSPPPARSTVATPGDHQDVIVKEGHRVVVVETFDDQGHHNTKVSISPSKEGEDDESGSALPIFGKPHHTSSDDTTRSPRELVCDSLGKCTHKIAKTIGNAKDRVSGKASEVAEGAKHGISDTVHQASGMASGAKHGISGSAEKAAELAHEAKDKVSRATQQATGKATEYAHHTKDCVSETAEMASEKASEVAHGAKDRIYETVEKASGKASEAFDKGSDFASQAKDKAGEAAKGVYSKAKDSAARSTEQVKEAVTDASDKAKSAAKSTKDVGKTIGKDVTRNVTTATKKPLTTIAGSVGSWLKGMLSVLNVLGLATAYGMSVWVTFISSYVLASVLPRQQLGMVQSKIYPVYFRAQSLSVGVALLAHLMRQWSNLLSSKSEMLQAFNLLVAILLVGVNGLYVEPLATKAMFERLRMEKEEGRGREQETQQHQLADAGPAAAGAELSEGDREEETTTTRMAGLNERVKKMNLCSSYLNIASVMSLTWHLVHLGHNLHVGSSQ